MLQGRLEGQAPDIDPVVYLTDCDPSVYGRGDLIRARIVGAQGYDLLATPFRLKAEATGRGEASASQAGSAVASAFRRKIRVY